MRRPDLHLSIPVVACCLALACADAPGGQCDDTAECPVGLICVDRVCRLSLDGARADGGDPGASCDSDSACDDGIDCTSDRCASGRCVSRGRDDLCGEGQLCHRELGCIVPGCDEETSCVSDGCATAECVDGACVRTSLCEEGTECCAGRCVLLGCDDGDPCTVDSCGQRGCDHVRARVEDGRSTDGGVCAP